MIIARFQVLDKFNSTYFFQKTFLLTNTNINIILEIFFLTLSNTNIVFANKKLI